MIDSITDISKQRISLLYPGLRKIAGRVLQNVYSKTGRLMNVTESIRSMDYQLSLYSQGRECVDGKWTIINPGKIVTNARPGYSFHCYGLAFDCAWAGQDPYLAKSTKAEQEELWNAYGEVVTAHGLTWGGHFKLSNGGNDKPHAELSFGLSIVDCFELFERGGNQKVWSHLDEIMTVV